MRLRHLIPLTVLAGTALAAPASAAANEPPQAAISCFPALVEVGTNLTCETDFAFDPDGAVVALEWDADDDGAYDDGTGDELTLAYDAAGIYDVRLRVSDDGGATAIASAEVEVFALGPGPVFDTSAEDVVLGDPVDFTAAFAPGEENGSVEYERGWDVDGDGDYDDWGTGNRSVRVWYEEPGTYAVRLRTQAIGGDPRDGTLVTRTITVAEEEPVVIGPSHPTPPGGGGGGGGGGAAPRPATFGSGGTVAKLSSTGPVVVPKTTPKPTSTTTKKASKKKCKTVKAKKGKKAKKRCVKPKKKASRKKK